MPSLERSALLRHSARDMFALVGDVEAYPQFLPGCTSARIEHAQGQQVRARLGFRVRGLSDSFATQNELGEHDIRMRLLDGPFRQLCGQWHFTALDERACKVSLQLSLEFGNRLLEMTLSPWIDRAVNNVMDAFRIRADTVYGRA
ncbi:type II toxin-antitoxin system RatA family toxin [Solimonas marina]|uniref:Type II toxin-antitoxin system RatA family toxin n=1 Tax=Solimonas marina TaxID=2714601 RepID=A0A969W9K3_9GAMM|nr:type II toxin-antitoxin system RatA family toxin [Solimonas marina]NKF23162.1 type II toxin-antitoxin system RatA family toxin [Solimonas marina]